MVGHTAFTRYAVLDQHRWSNPEENVWRKGHAKVVGTPPAKAAPISQARVSALGEAIERYRTQYCEYEPVLTATWAEVAKRAIHPHSLNPFSAAQYRDRLKWIRRGWTSYVPMPFEEQAAI